MNEQCGKAAKFFWIIITSITSTALILIVTAVIFSISAVFIASDKLENVTQISIPEPEKENSSYIYCINSTTNEYDLVYKVTPYTGNIKIETDASSLPEYVKGAFISIEDERFYSHDGIDIKMTTLAVIKEILRSTGFMNSEVTGGSTITQQLVKNITSDNELSIDRKLREISRAVTLETNYTKEQILEKYLNIIYFGNNTYGIEEASNYYFSKESKDLSLSETSLLAGLIKSPSKYSPINHKEKAKQRRNLVIDEMAKDNKLSLSEAIKLKNEDIVLSISHDRENKLNTYSEQAIDEAIKILKMPAKHIANGAYKIYTYQSAKMQKKLKDAFDKASLKDVEYAGISVDPTTGGVDAYIGKSAYKILEHKRQPGSLVKPILVYAPAMEENLISLLHKFLMNLSLLVISLQKT